MAKNKETQETTSIIEGFNPATFLDEWETEGAAISKPVLNEGNYLAHIVAITPSHGTRTNKLNKEEVWCRWQVTLDLDSLGAKEVMKTDNDVRVYASGDCEAIGKGQFLNLVPYGIDRNNNAGLWNFVGSLLKSAELAEIIKDDSGAEQVKIDRHFIEQVYNGIEDEYLKLKSSSDIDVITLPALLAGYELNNLTQLITSEQNTSRCYVHIARNTYSKGPNKGKMYHYVKNIMLAEEFESDDARMSSLVL